MSGASLCSGMLGMNHPKRRARQRIDLLGVQVRPVKPANELPDLPKRSVLAMLRTRPSIMSRFYGRQPDRRYTSIGGNEGIYEGAGRSGQ